jgi:type 1 glutamine amidotransferase/glucose/arabinose dehydrogenase
VRSIGATLALVLLALPVHAQPRAKKIVLLAGPLDSHPKDTHEYERNIILLKHCLEGSPSFKGARVELHFNGWPADSASLDDADTIFMTTRGSGEQGADAHPIYNADRLQVLERQMKRGCGLIFHHWSTFHPVKAHDQITEWNGGYFDHESGPPAGKWYSKIETKEWTTVVGSPGHPIARGVMPFKVKEEFYYRLRFRENDPRLKFILLKDGTEPPASAVAWAVERGDGGRGFGFTGGHFFANWWVSDFRRLVLNAIAWTAKIDVPEGGVESTLEEPLRALILTGHHHPAHDWKATTAALIHVLEQDPRMKVEVSENPEDLAGARLDTVDLLVLNYCNWDKPGLSDAAKAGFLKYLERGGGLSVIHFANGAWNKTLPAKESDWEDYRSKIVRRVWMHPESAHDPYGPFPVTITPLKHEITAELLSFETKDELYMKQAGSLPIEALATARSKITGAEEPLAWAYEIGQARAFQTLLGHSADSIRGAAALIRRGATWAGKRSPLGFDPPTDRLEKATFRPGSRWTGQASPEPPKPQVLPSDPGLDGGKGGHWGLTGEADWKDARWNASEVGPFMTSALKVGKETILRAISIKLGDGGAVFDADACTFRAGWTGGFLAFSPARYGLIEMPRIAGEIRWTSEEKWSTPPRYRGLHLYGERVVLSYEVDGASVLELIRRDGDNFVRTFKIGPHSRPLKIGSFEWPPSVEGLLGCGGAAEPIPSEPGPARWKPIETKGQLGHEKGPYVVDTLTVPYDNPWKALMFLSGVDFFPNGDAAVCTIHGDVWLVKGIDEQLQNLTWRRYATGLYQPLGLRIVDDQVYVLGRDRITRLVDVDRDGEADLYENFCSDLPTSAAGHDFITCLETGKAGNFYFTAWKGLFRVSRDGKKTELLATGFRNPNGLSVGPDGTITVAPQEGEWTPASAIAIAKEGGYYGYGGPKITPERPLGYDPPLCWIPRRVDNSTGGQAWVTSDRWGPLEGQLLSFSFGQSSMMLVLREQVDGLWQGGIVPFKLAFASGAMRGRFRPKDGQLYVAGTKGWVSNATRDGCLQRVRYTGATVHLPVAMHATAGTLRLIFSGPLDKEIAQDVDGWSAEQWNYLYGAQYGSKEFSANHPNVEGHDAVEIKAARLSEDGRTVSLDIPTLKPVMQLRLRYSLRGADGSPVKGEVDGTIHRLGKN